MMKRVRTPNTSLRLPLIIFSVFLFLAFATASTGLAEVKPFLDYTNKNAVYGGTYRTLSTPPRSIDPHMGTAGNEAGVMNLIYNGLLRLTPDYVNVEPDLAKSWRQIDDVTYEFKLHEGIRFHDVPPVNGRQCTSADIKYTIERIAGQHGKKSNFKHRYYFENKLESIQTPDKYTVIIKTKEPYAPFIRYIASPWSKIVPKEAVDEFGDLKRKGIGTGPFILKEYVKGSHMTYDKHPKYFKKGLPYLDGIHVKLMRDPNAALSAFLAGKFDGLWIYFFQVPTIKKEAPDATIRIGHGSYIWTLRCPPWIEGKKPLQAPFNKKEVRQAIAMAIDKKKLLKLAWGGQGTPTVGPMASFFPWALSPEEQVEYNPEKAKKLLAEAGYPNGFKTELMTWSLPYVTKPAQVVQQMLKDVGIEVELKILEMAQYFNKAYRFDYQMALHIMTAAVDPEEMLLPYYGPLATSTYYKWSNPDLWDMISKQSGIMDPEKRTAYIKEIQRKLLDESPNIYLYTQHRFAVSRPYVHSQLYKADFQIGMAEETWMEKH
jgi:peptide/nickel transport system substrate-binding protein